VARSKAPKAGADWLREHGPGYPLVLSCRARVARNIEGLPFPVAAGEEELERSRGMVLEAVSRRVADEKDWDIRFAEELSRNRLEMMAEEHVTSQSFSERLKGRAVAIGPGDGRSVMVNEEDHVRVQAILPGAQFMKVWKAVDDVDSRIESEIQYCFDQKVGYLTTCPSNVGTGLRVSAMLHLPALVTTGEIGKTISALGQAGIYVRGLYGEGSGVAGNIFQISNRQTLGRTEEFIVSNIDMIVRQVVDNERTARKMMLREDPLDLTDRVHRSLGVVERCRRVCYYEALEMISLVKLGVDTEVLPVADFNILEVGVGIGPYHLRELLGGEAGEEEIDRERAVHLRRMLGL
jgi:protein arginine kinase